ncbi:MAG: hypothetical protein ACFB0A_03385 [Croceivirga sp.]|mgnify:CR=1 FL=1
MKKIIFTALLLWFVSIPFNGYAQETRTLEKVRQLEQQKEVVTKKEKQRLKDEVKAVNERLKSGLITEKEAQILKEEAARKIALNIENQLAIIDNRIEFLKRNEGDIENSILDDKNSLIIDFTDDNDKEYRILGIRFNNKNWERPVKFDRRTYSDFVVAIGFNNAIIEGQSLDDSPYKIGGSRFFEMGLQWRTRVFKNSNWLRLNYGLSFQFNGLKPDNNQYFVQNGDQTELQEFDVELDKSKLRMDNLVFPIHLEFGPSKRYQSEEKIRYSIRKQFRMGIGGYGGFNIGTRQKLKYTRNGEDLKDKLKRGYNTSNLIYGLSAYLGFGKNLLYAKYDLNPIFRNAVVEQRNVSLGMRFDLD